MYILTMFLLALPFFVNCLKCWNVRVVKSSILHFAPQIKLHHIVVVSNPDFNSSYTIDFTPIKQQNINTIRDLALGKYVPAEIRIRYIQNKNSDDEDLIENWNSQNQISHEESYKKTHQVLKRIRDDELKDYFDTLLKWNGGHMNLYFANCQHFSRYALRAREPYASLTSDLPSMRTKNNKKGGVQET
jgi:hypothetical protein